MHGSAFRRAVRNVLNLCVGGSDTLNPFKKREHNKIHNHNKQRRGENDGRGNM